MGVSSDELVVRHRRGLGAPSFMVLLAAVLLFGALPAPAEVRVNTSANVQAGIGVGYQNRYYNNYQSSGYRGYGGYGGAYSRYSRYGQQSYYGGAGSRLSVTTGFPGCGPGPYVPGPGFVSGYAPYAAPQTVVIQERPPQPSVTVNTQNATIYNDPRAGGRRSGPSTISRGGISSGPSMHRAGPRRTIYRSNTVPRSDPVIVVD